VRSRKNVSLTEAGRLYLEFFSRMSEEFNQLRDSIAKKSAAGGSILSLGVLEWLDLSSVLERLHLKHRSGSFPEVLIDRLPKFELAESFKNRIYDIIITYSEDLPTARYSKTLILETSYICLSRGSHPKAGSAASIMDFVRGTLFLYRNPDFSDYVTAQCQRYG
jgi:DNA-binding transcriptional LysR family regulator